MSDFPAHRTAGDLIQFPNLSFALTEFTAYSHLTTRGEVEPSGKFSQLVVRAALRSVYSALTEMLILECRLQFHPNPKTVFFPLNVFP